MRAPKARGRLHRRIIGAERGPVSGGGGARLRPGLARLWIVAERDVDHVADRELIRVLYELSRKRLGGGDIAALIRRHDTSRRRPWGVWRGRRPGRAGDPGQGGGARDERCRRTWSQPPHQAVLAPNGTPPSQFETVHTTMFAATRSSSHTTNGESRKYRSR